MNNLLFRSCNMQTDVPINYFDQNIALLIANIRIIWDDKFDEIVKTQTYRLKPLFM